MLLNLQDPGDVNSGAQAAFCLKNCPNGQPGTAIQFLINLRRLSKPKGTVKLIGVLMYGFVMDDNQ